MGINRLTTKVADSNWGWNLVYKRKIMGNKWKEGCNSSKIIFLVQLKCVCSKLYDFETYHGKELEKASWIFGLNLKQEQSIKIVLDCE